MEILAGRWCQNNCVRNAFFERACSILYLSLSIVVRPFINAMWSERQKLAIWECSLHKTVDPKLRAENSYFILTHIHIVYKNIVQNESNNANEHYQPGISDGPNPLNASSTQTIRPRKLASYFVSKCSQHHQFWLYTQIKTYPICVVLFFLRFIDSE